MLTKLLITLIKSLLWVLDPDHRERHVIDRDNIKKFTHVQDVNFQSDFGRAKKAFRTVPYEVWELKTATKTLTAADKHRVVRADNSCVWVSDLVPGDLIQTDIGLERVELVRPLGIKTHMFCIEVETEDKTDPRNHLYYTNGILSHNTTCAAGFLLWKAMFTPDATILVAANKFVQAIEIMDRIKYAYENLPDHIRAGVLEYNKSAVAFDNGSRIISRATAPDAGRGLSITLLYLDEFSFVATNKQSSFWTAMTPVLSVGGSCIITSTPKSDEDQFAQIWKGAEDNVDEFGIMRPGGVGKNNFFAVKAPWWEHPERDEEWANTYREQLGEARFQQEFCCSFVTDDETLINPLTLVRLSGMQPIYYTGTVRWYREPEPNKTYMCSLDPSLGTGGDAAAIQVFQLPEMIQIAEWQHNGTAPRGQVKVLMQTMIYLDSILRENPNHMGVPDIYWTVENNTIGEAILQIIEDTGEERFPGVLMSERKRKGVTRRFRKGMNTTNKSKLSACARLKSLVESDRITINSGNLIRELKNFVAKESTFSAKPGEHDDLVSALLLVIRMLDQVVNWSMQNSGDLKEYIGDDDLMDTEPMPVVV